MFHISDQKKQLIKLYNEARDSYKARNFSEALGLFKKALEIEPKDGPSKLYIERCEAYIASPPPADWDGVWIMTTK